MEEADTRACLLFQVWGNRGYDGVSKLSSSCLGGSWISLQPCRKEIAQKGGGAGISERGESMDHTVAMVLCVSCPIVFEFCL